MCLFKEIFSQAAQDLLARGSDGADARLMGNPGQAEARLLARTDVDARRELHNGTNNAGDIINSFGKALSFSDSKYGFHLS